MIVVFIGFMVGGLLRVPVFADESSGTGIKSAIEEIKNAKSESQRLKALQKLHGQKPASAEDVQALLGALRDKVMDFNTTEILWGNDNPQLAPFLPILIRALDDADLDVQGAAALTLGKMKAREAVPNLIKRFESIPLIDDRSPLDERKKAETYGRLGMFLATSLGMIGDPAAVPALIARREFYYLEFGETPLAWIGAPALPALLKVAKDKKDPRREHIYFIISKIKDPAAIPFLKEVANDSAADPDLKKSALTALANMGNPKVEP
jgi:HEAT repeat protein